MCAQINHQLFKEALYKIVKFKITNLKIERNKNYISFSNTLNHRNLIY